MNHTHVDSCLWFFPLITYVIIWYLLLLVLLLLVLVCVCACARACVYVCTRVGYGDSTPGYINGENRNQSRYVTQGYSVITRDSGLPSTHTHTHSVHYTMLFDVMIWPDNLVKSTHQNIAYLSHYLW